MIYPVILAGGSGTRLWPLSRELHPKQLLGLVTDNTMLQDTLIRLSGVEDMAAPIVICNENHRFMVAEQLRAMGMGHADIILEPVGRNTAPAVAVAALRALASGDDPLLLILPADHFIRDTQAFQKAVSAGVRLAGQDRLITFGIVPDAPETGYGYIKKGRLLSEEAPEGGPSAVAIERFVEKPDYDTAVAYVDSGDFCWNSGMFLFRAATLIAEMETWAPEMVAACRQALENGREDLDFFRLDRPSFEACPSDSIDYAVMEKTARGAMIPLQAGWSDLGSWEALWQAGKKDADDNVVHGDVLLHNVSNSYLRAGTRLIAAVGLKDHIVVETADAVLISPRSGVQDVKILVNKLKDARRGETVTHKTAFKPWGNSENLVKSEGFQVNLLTVKPGAALALQKHFNRAEHWIVVRGTAMVVRGDEEIILNENSATFIPQGLPHRLSNPGKIPLEIVEVQSGDYFGENDIIRLEDPYGEMRQPE
ncbi:mannose-1-phosphate guanylyltransferase/mannose-6-phosphate isomerase [Desulfococcus sp.]|uniref:mannose-1-phosphate guanylyltransferase/mannose-6-phosphate isomerase n=1 Tax=Desulfococcus sp. TaxID=2025834 RepID=UPI0035941586